MFCGPPRRPAAANGSVSQNAGVGILFSRSPSGLRLSSICQPEPARKAPAHYGPPPAVRGDERPPPASDPAPRWMSLHARRHQPDLSATQRSASPRTSAGRRPARCAPGGHHLLLNYFPATLARLLWGCDPPPLPAESRAHPRGKPRVGETGSSPHHNSVGELCPGPVVAASPEGSARRAPTINRRAQGALPARARLEQSGAPAYGDRPDQGVCRFWPL